MATEHSRSISLKQPVDITIRKNPMCFLFAYHSVTMCDGHNIRIFVTKRLAGNETPIQLNQNQNIKV